MARKSTVKLPDVFAKPGQAPSRGTPIESLPREGEPEPSAAEPVPAPAVAEPGPVAGAAPVTGDGPPASWALASRPALVVGAPDGAQPPVVLPPDVAAPDAATPDAPASESPVSNPVSGSAAPADPVPTPQAAAPVAEASPVGETPSALPPVIAAPTAAPPASPVIPPAVVAPPVPPAPKSTVPSAVPLAAPSTPPPSMSPPATPSRPAHAEPPRPAVTVPPPRGPAWTIAMVALGVSLTTPFWYDGALRLLGITTTIGQAQQEDALAISRQERKLRDVEQRLSTTATQLTKAQADLTQAARKQEETAAWTRVMILARLGEALRRGTPFGPELAMARGARAATGDLTPLLDRFAPYAPIGVPTTQDLGQDFRRVTDPVLRPARGLNPLAWAATVIAWTPFGRPAPETDPGRLALREAASRVRDGAVTDAATMLRPVTGPVADMMAGWLADADARAAADAFNQRIDALLRAGPR